MAECIMNATQIADSNNVITAERLVNTFTANADNIWKPIIKNVSIECLANFTNLKIPNERPKNLPLNEIACKPISGYLMDCIHKNIFLRCPASNMDKTAPAGACNKVKAYLEDCPLFMLHAEGHHSRFPKPSPTPPHIEPTQSKPTLKSQPKKN